MTSTPNQIKFDSVQVTFPQSIINFNIDSRYQDITPEGEDQEGYFVSAYDNLLKRKIRITKLKDVKNKSYMKRRLRDIVIQRHFRGHENIYTIIDLMTYPPHILIFDEVYIVSVNYDACLSNLIKSVELNQLTEQHFQFFTYQFLRAMKFIHSAGIIHNNLNSENLLITSACDLMVTGFYMSTAVPPTSESFETHASMFMRNDYSHCAPELLAESTCLDRSADVWSIGVILAELVSHKQTFFHGNTSEQVLTSIIDTFEMDEFCLLLGDAEYKDTQIMKETLNRYKTSPNNCQSSAYGGNTNFIKLFPPTTSFLALDLIRKMLEPNPSRRINVDQALMHPYLATYQNNIIEPSYDQKLFDQLPGCLMTPDSFLSLNSTNSMSLSRPSFTDIHAQNIGFASQNPNHVIPNHGVRNGSQQMQSSGQATSCIGSNENQNYFTACMQPQLSLRPSESSTVNSSVKCTDSQSLSLVPPTPNVSLPVTNNHGSMTIHTNGNLGPSAKRSIADDDFTSIDVKMLLFNEMKHYRHLSNDILLFLSLDDYKRAQVPAGVSSDASSNVTPTTAAAAVKDNYYKKQQNKRKTVRQQDASVKPAAKYRKLYRNVTSSSTVDVASFHEHEPIPELVPYPSSPASISSLSSTHAGQQQMAHPLTHSPSHISQKQSHSHSQSHNHTSPLHKPTGIPRETAYLSTENIAATDPVVTTAVADYKFTRHESSSAVVAALPRDAVNYRDMEPMIQYSPPPPPPPPQYHSFPQQQLHLQDNKSRLFINIESHTNNSSAPIAVPTGAEATYQLIDMAPHVTAMPQQQMYHSSFHNNQQYAHGIPHTSTNNGSQMQFPSHGLAKDYYSSQQQQQPVTTQWVGLSASRGSTAATDTPYLNLNTHSYTYAHTNANANAHNNLVPPRYADVTQVYKATSMTNTVSNDSYSYNNYSDVASEFQAQSAQAQAQAPTAVNQQSNGCYYHEPSHKQTYQQQQLVQATTSYATVAAPAVHHAEEENISFLDELEWGDLF